MVRDGGRVIVCSQYTDRDRDESHWQPTGNIGEGLLGLTVTTSTGGRAHRAYGSQRPWKEMVSGRYDLNHADEALKAIEDRTAIKAIITPNPDLVK